VSDKSALKTPTPVCMPDLSAGPFNLRFERRMRAAPDAIFNSRTRHFDGWFAEPGTVLMRAEVNAPFFETQFKVEGAKAQCHPHYGRFLALEPNRLVVMTSVTGPEGTRGAETIVRLRLSPRGHGRQLTLEHRGFPDRKSRDQHRKAWPVVLTNLDKSLMHSD